MMSGMTVGLLKEILKENNLSDDDVIDFYFTFTSEKNLRGQKYIQKESREMEFEGIYKKHNKGEGIIIEFEPTEVDE